MGSAIGLANEIRRTRAAPPVMAMSSPTVPNLASSHSRMAEPTMNAVVATTMPKAIVAIPMVRSQEPCKAPPGRPNVGCKPLGASVDRDGSDLPNFSARAKDIHQICA